MSNTVEDRILQMNFDNKQFERGVSDTLNSLGKLDKSINNLSDAKLTPLVNGIGKVSDSFSFLANSASVAFGKIIYDAVAAGKKVVDAFTIDPIKTGFQEYETQINAIQTILANTKAKGTTLDDVNKALDELNKYADMTIYNFTQMTRNIGTFTAAGVDLDTSVSAIKGIANLAAVSGSTSEQASRAMYQLSQALASGTVKLQDWNSVVNAGMGGEVFQNALKDTARVHGIAIDEMIKANGSFRESLSKTGWLTTDILTETLAKFTGDLTESQLKQMGYTEKQIADIIELGRTANDAATKVKTFTQLWDTLSEAAQSGWTQSWEIIVGDFEQAKDLLTMISDALQNVINSTSDARNKLLQTWADLGGRTALIDSLKNAGKALYEVFKVIGESIRNVFPPITAERLAAITNGIRDFTQKLILGDSVMRERLEKTLTGLFSIIHIGWSILQRVGNYLSKLVAKLSPLVDVFFAMTAGIGDFFRILDNSINKIGFFNTFVKESWRVAEYAKIAYNNFRESLNKSFGTDNPVVKFFDKIRYAFDGFSTTIHNILMSLNLIDSSDFGRAFSGIGDEIWTTIKSMWKVLRERISGFVTNVGNVFVNIGVTIKEALKKGLNWENIFVALGSGVFAKIALNIKNFVTSIFGPVEDLRSWLSIPTKIAKSIEDVLSSAKDSLTSFQNAIKIESLKAIATAVAILTGSLFVLAMIPEDNLASGLGGISILIGELVASLHLLKGAIGTRSDWVKNITRSLMALSISMIFFASAVKKLSGINFKDMLGGLIGLFFIFGELMVFLNNTNFANGQIVKKTEGLSTIKQSMIKMAAGLVLLSIAVNILVGAVKKLSAMEFMPMMQGLFGVIATLASMAVFINQTDFSGFGMRKGGGLLLVATSMLILGSIIKKLSSMDFIPMMQGLFGVIVTLASIAVFINQTDFKGFTIGSIGLILMATAMNILIAPVTKMANMDWKNLLLGLGGLLALFTEISLFTKFTNSVDLLAVGASLLMISGALTILSGAIQSMGSNWQSSLIGLLSFAGILGVLAVTAPALAPALGILAIPMLAVGAALALIGVGFASAGAGAMMFTAVFIELAAAGNLVLVGILKFIEYIPTLVNAFVLGFVSLLTSIAQAGPEINKALLQIITSACELIEIAAPRVANAVLVVIAAVLAAIDAHVEPIVRSIISIIKKVANVLYEDVDIIRAVVDMFNNVLDKISLYIAAFILAGKDLIDGIITGFKEKRDWLVAKIGDLIIAARDKIKEFVEKFKAVGKMLINGLVEGLKNNDSVAKVATNVGKVILDSVKNKLKIASPSKEGERIGKYFDVGLANGIDGNSNIVEAAGSNLGTSLLNGLGEKIKNGTKNIFGGTMGPTAGGGLFDGFKSLDDSFNFDAFEKIDLTSLIKFDDVLGDLTPKITSADTSNIVNEMSNVTSAMGIGTEATLGLTDGFDTITSANSDWMSQLEANGPIMDQTTRGLYAMTDATEALNQTTGDTSKSMEEVMKNFHKIEKVDRVMLGAKALEYYDDYYKLKKAGILDGSRDDFKDFFTGKENVTGVKGYWQLISNMQEEFAKERADLFTRGDIDKIYDDEFKKYLHENMSRYQYDWTYMRGVVPTWTNDWIDAQGFKVTQEQIDQMMNAVPAQNGAYGYGGYGMDYTSYLSTLTNDVDSMNAKLNDIYTRINQLQVVLDTGAIAGAVMQPVDNYIGTKMVYAARGMI